MFVAGQNDKGKSVRKAVTQSFRSKGFDLWQRGCR